ncbi:MAG: phosphoserine phosphatase SerB [Psychrobium sp.]|nr:phosphoserine phosphatase SerB [Psychrobium sp.]
MVWDKQQKLHLLAAQQPDESGQVVTTDVAWPVSQHKLIITAKSIDKSCIDALMSAIGKLLMAMLPINQVAGYQSIELLLTQDIAVDSLAPLAARYQLDINKQTNFPDLNKPGLVVLDMDSTSIQIECIDEIAKLAGVGDEVSEITELAMQGKLDFAESLRARVAKLKGIKLSLLDSIANDLPLMPGMTELVAQFKRHHWKIAIASGGFTYFADNLKQQLNLDDAISNVLAHENGVLTGQVNGHIVDAVVKAETIVKLAEKYGIEPSQTIAIGDGANDLLMMQQAALGIAYHAKPLVQDKADTSINHGDLASIITMLAR